MRFWTLVAAVVLVLSGAATTADATGTVTWGKITHLGGGWTVPLFAVETTTTVVNPDNCPAASPYVVPPNSPSHDMFVSMLLTAYARGDLVELTVSGCDTWPVIIGVRIRPAT